MYSKELMKGDLMQQLIIIQSINFQHNTQKITLDSNGNIVTINPEKTVPLDSYNLSSIEHHLKYDFDYQEASVKFLIGYLVKAKSLNFIDYVFEEIFEEFQLYLEGKYVYRTIALIHHFDIQNDEIQLSDFVIKPVDKENIEYFYNTLEMYNTQHNFTFRHKFDSHEPNARVLLERKQVLSGFEDDNSFREKIEKLAESILLYNGTLNHIYFSPIITFSYFADNGMIQTIKHINKVHNKLRKKNVIIKSPQLLTDYFNKLIQLPTKSIALDRLASAHNKIDLGDKFIDLIISLESMYPSVRGELLFRISLYTAGLLDGSPDTYKKVKNLYGIRSNLVHGNSNLPQEKLAKELEGLDRIVRQIIVKSLDYSIQGVKLEKMEEDIIKKLLPN
ncbi:HEPN domain-containing protein [Bacillus cereus group sp. RP37]|uniref:hypothetical protein n=1 Tax=Bacillus cereus group sp. RP37 TaxID=3040259 RepID=UPI003394C369